MNAIETRFWDKVEKIPDGCWEWTAGKSRGYGQFRLDGRMVNAHRFAFGMLVGPIPSGMELDHICHNPACVNPTHLRTCTPAENSQNQAIPKNNTSGLKGVCWDKRNKRWLAQIQMNGKRIQLGRFSTPEAAHAAYCRAATLYHGEFANFGSGGAR